MSKKGKVLRMNELTPMQNGMLFHSLLDEGGVSYHVQLSYLIEGQLHVAILKQAWQELINRHEIFRTYFIWEKVKTPVQVVVESKEADIDEADISDLNPMEQNEYLDKYKQKHLHKQFDFQESDLNRLSILKLARDRYFLCWTFHHILLDGWSSALVMQELFILYSHIAGDYPLPVKPSAQFGDYLDWLKRQDLTKGIQFWTEYMQDFTRPTELPYDKKPESGTIQMVDKNITTIPEEEAAKIYEFCQKNSITTNAFFQTLWGVLLQKYNNEPWSCFGTTVSGRPHDLKHVEDIVGLFINTIPVLVKAEDNISIRELLQQVHHRLSEARQYEHVPLVEIKKMVGDVDHLFDSLIGFENFPSKKSSEVQMEVKISSDSDFELTNHNLTLIIDSRTEVVLKIIYNSELFQAETIDRIQEHLAVLIDEFLQNPDQRVNEICLLTEQERSELIYGWNQTQTEYPKDKTIVQLLEAQVAKTPDQVAIRYKEVELSYRELNEKANQLARILRSRGIGPDRIVGLLMDHSPEALIGIWGILKAGGAYLPIDPDYPDDRITYMLQDSETELCLTQRHLQYKVDDSIDIELLDNEELYIGDCSNLPPIHTPEDLVYIIYTSGSTGRPKGVMIQHRGLVNYVTWASKVYLQGEKCSFPLYSSLAFDLTVTSIYTPLVTGNQVIIYHSEEKEMLIHQIIEEDQVQVIKLTPAHLQLIKNMEITHSGVKRLIVGGEQLKSQLARGIYDKFAGRIELYNEYGPTETVVGCMIHRYDPTTDIRQAVPIGVPADNVQIYLLDPSMNPVGLNIPGEIYIGGDGVARGYLNRPELTQERFVDSPFIHGEKLYRTGDLAKRLPNGLLEFGDRIDHQVKMRGFRIELGEVEYQLAKHEWISETVVVAKEDSSGSNVLIAFYIAKREIPTSDLREFLLKNLPEYMVPTHFVRLAEFPLTTNGKVDKHKLPDVKANISKDYVPPRTELEKQLAAIWEDVLEMKPIGITDNFFELGGDSVKAIQILGRANKLGVKMSLRKIFKYRTIARMLENTDSAEDKVTISQNEIKGEVLLTPVQKWFFALQLDHPQYFNQTNLFILGEDVDLQRLEEAWKAVITHHDALRMSYRWEHDQVVQYNRGVDEVNFKLEHVDLSTLPYDEQKQKMAEFSMALQDRLNLETDLLIQAVVFDLGPQGRRLLVPIHHLIIDGVSWRILLEDLQTVYSSGSHKSLPAKTTSFKEWSEKLHHYAKTEEMDTEYWEKLDPGTISSLVSQPVKENRLIDFKNLTFAMNDVHTRDLMTRVNQAYNTEINDILLSALTLALTETTSAENLLLVLEGHGREEILSDVDLNRTVGWFTSNYPVYLSRKENLAKTIQHVKESLRKIPNKGVNFGIARYLQHHEKLGRLNPEITFNYLGQLDSSKGSNGDKGPILTMSRESSGASTYIGNQNEHLMNINGWVLGGKLQIWISYNAKYIDSAIVKRLQTLYQQKLEEIIDHCVQQKEQVYTASDFDLHHYLSVEEFAELATQVNFEEDKVYPLTPLQEGMLFYNLYNPSSKNYRIQCCFRIEGDLQVELLKAAWAEVVNRYEIFKTRFIWKHVNRPVQVIAQKNTPEVDELDLTHLDSAEQATYLEEFKAQELEKGFDFTSGKLNRITILKLALDRYYICWMFHHILADGWSVSRVLMDLFRIYNCLENGIPLPQAPGAHFSDYLEWWKNQNQRQAMRYWQETMRDVTEPTFLPSDLKEDQNIVSQVQREIIHLAEEKTNQIKDLCGRLNITMNAFFETAWGLLLQKYNNTDTSCFGITVSGRPHELKNVEEIVGILINSVPMVINAKSQCSIHDVLVSVNDKMTEITNYDYIPLAEIQKMAGKTRDLFDSIYVFENYPVAKAFREAKTSIRVSLDSNFELTNYDMCLTIISNEQTLIHMDSNVARFSKRQAAQIRAHLLQVIDTILTEPECKVNDLCIITDAERAYLLSDFNQTAVDYPKEKLINQLFEEQVQIRPDQMAVIFEDMSLTYQQLNQRANQLARLLRAKGVVRDQAVAIMLDSPMDVIISILGIVKAGGAYLPIDSSYPDSRIEFMLEDSEAHLLLTETEFIGRYPKFCGEVVDITNAQIYQGDNTNLEPIHQPGDLIYIIYTSGSTGQPKGVMIEHRNVNRLISNSDIIRISPEDRVLQASSVAFDAFTMEIWGALLNGARLYLMKRNDVLSPATFAQKVEEYRITQMFHTTALFHQYAEENPAVYRTLHRLYVGGERTSVRYMNLVKQHFPELNLIHCYGPTESTTYATSYLVQSGHAENLPIGKPISNTTVYVVDQDLHLQPVGAPGELCIGGDGLARGYLKRPALTAEKFIDNPYQPGTKMYKSGDLVRWLPDGNLEFLGRMDHQVKIRGLRIELGEIEVQLLKHPDIKEVVVVDHKDGNGSVYLVAYFVTDRVFEGNELKEFLAVELPNYMIPSCFIRLSELPLTTNGKVDRRALPAPQIGSVDKETYAAPTNEVEAQMVAIWEEVLGIQQVGIHDNYFDLGGDSIKAIQILARTERSGIQMGVKDLFVHLTIANIAKNVMQKETIIDVADAKPTDFGGTSTDAVQNLLSPEEFHYLASRADGEYKLYPLTPLQEGMLFYKIYYPDSRNYHSQFCFTVQGDLKVELLQTAWENLIARHEMYRTRFFWENVSSPVQMIMKEHQAEMYTYDITALSVAAQDHFLDNLKAEELKKDFDFEAGKLNRLSVIQFADDQFYIIWMIHHIIFDGWSMSLALSDLLHMYHSLEKGLPWPEASQGQFSSYLEWLRKQDQEKGLEFWKGFLQPLDSVTYLPVERKGLEGKIVTQVGGDHVCLDTATTSQIRELCRSLQITVNAFFQTVWGVLLQKYNNVDTSCFGMTVSGRPYQLRDVEKIVGILINTLPVVVVSNSRQTLKELLTTVNQQLIDIREFEYLPLVKIQKLSHHSGDLFDSLIAFDNLPMSKALQETQVGFDITADSNSGMTNYDLSLEIVSGSDTLIVLRYNAERFTEQNVTSIKSHLLKVVDTILTAPEMNVSNLSLLTDLEKTRIIEEFNDTRVEYPVEKTIVQLFEEQVEKTPDQIAVVYEHQHLTYQQLNSKANQLARVLLQKGVLSEQPVGLRLNNGLEQIIGILAIVKAGGVYLPIDPSYPENRVEFMLNDSGAQLVLTEQQRINVSPFPGECLDITDPMLYQGDRSNLQQKIKPEDLICIFYTSGSTGKPKGVMVEHRNVNRLISHSNMIKISGDDRILQAASVAFDASTFEIWGSLLNGAQLYLIHKDDIVSPANFAAKMREYQISQIFQTTALFNQMVEEFPEVYQTLHSLYMGGERNSPKHIHQIRELYPQLRLVHCYGPTESTTFTTFFEVTNEYRDNVPIGKPVSNTQVFILDKDRNVQPIGVPGELYIGGDGLARGYLNRADLTSEKFVDNPFDLGTKLYRSGDLVRWLEDGNIEFVGRIDNQVKIRGFRIELGEIEAQLHKHPEIKEVVIIDGQDERGSKYLAAYIVSATEIEVGQLREFLSQELPPYMIPAYFVPLQELPLNSNGKVDRSALPAPQIQRGICDTYAAPTNEAEEKLVKIWGEVLGVECVGIHDNFFELAGDSIKAIQILARVKQHGLNFSLSDIFQYGTIAEMVKHVDYHLQTVLASQEEVTGTVPLTPIQHWFFEQKLKYPNYFNQTNLFALPENVDLARLERALAKLVEHHDALRISYHWQDDQVIQHNQSLAEADFRLEYVDLSAYSSDEQKEELLERSIRIQGSFDLQVGLLCKPTVFDLGVNGKRLLLPIHHLVIDNVSWRIILEDLQNLYDSNLEQALPLKTTSFKEWSERLTNWAQSGQVDIQYWEKIKPAEIHSLVEQPVVENRWRDHQSLHIELDPAQTTDLLTKVGGAYNTQIDDILLSALTMAFTEAAHVEHLLITLEGHGREEILPGTDLTRTVGWFTSAYPVYLQQRTSIPETIKYVKENLRQIPNKGIHYGVARYLQKNHALEKLHPEIAFNYHGQVDAHPKSNDESRALLRGCSENAGSDIHPENQGLHLININGAVLGGKLQLILFYNAHSVSTSMMKEVQALFKERLVQIIEHCLQQKERVYTPSDLGLQNMFELEEFDYLTTQVNLVEEKVYPLTPLQEGMLFYKLYNPASRHYYVQTAFQVQGRLKVDLLRMAWQELVNRYEIFRTRFLWKKINRLVQVIGTTNTVEFNEHDITGLNPTEQTQYFLELKEQELDTRFDFEAGQLNRLAFVKQAEDRYSIVWTFHHIIADGWSLSIVLGDLFRMYACLENGNRLPEPPKAQFTDYLEWLKQQDRAQGVQFWRDYLADFTEQTPLPADLKRERDYIAEVATEYLILDEEKASRVKELCKNVNITVSAFFNTAWGLLLQKYNNTSVSCSGMTVSGRPYDLPNVEAIVGILINTVPVVIHSHAEDPIQELLVTVNRQLAEVQKYEYVPLSEIQRIAGNRSLFDSIIVFENYPVSKAAREVKAGLQVIPESSYEMTHYDMSITIMSEDQISIRMNYDAERFTGKLIQRVRAHLSNIIEAMIIHPELPVGQIAMVTEEERARIAEFNNTAADIRLDTTVDQIFEEWVEKQPNKPALKYQGQEISYLALSEETNQLARILLKKGVGTDQLVGVLMDRSPVMAKSILATWKAGGAYIPIDTVYPFKRVLEILTDSGASVLLAESKYISPELREAYAGEILEMDLAHDVIAQESVDRVERVNHVNDLAYVLYTSGSTGKPKGAMVEHLGMLNHMWAKLHDMVVTQDSVMVQNASQCFDISVWQYFGALVVGGQTVIYPNEVALNPEKLLNQLVEDRVTALQVVPAFLGLMLDSVEDTFIPLPDLHRLSVTGEAVKPNLVKRWFALYPHIPIVNTYGVTECSDDVTHYTMDQDPGTESISIGSPIYNTKIHILDNNMNLCPIGVKGELYVSGIAVGRGYLNDPERTRKVFMTDPLVEESGRLYRIGDLGRWLEDGNIEFFGRKDYQIKIRGHRVELGEIESKLVDHPEIKEAAVVDKKDGNGNIYLCAYLQTENELDIAEIRSYLAETLPEHMIPAYFVQLESMPVNTSGKIDRKALPDVQGQIQIGTEYVAPENEVQAKLVTIWTEILGVEKIGIHDDFFLLGGQSLMAIQLSTKVAKELDADLPLEEIFKSTTIKELSDYIITAEKAGFETIVKAPEQDDYPASSAQKRMYTLWQLEGKGTAYNMAGAWTIEGNFDLEQAKRAITALIQRHESLRTSFDLIDGEVVQIVHPDLEFDFNYYETDESEYASIIHEWSGPFDLQQVPLFRIGIVRSAPTQYLFLLEMHHIISDGISMEVLFREFFALYRGIELPELRIQYKDYAVWQHQWMQSELMQKQEQFWLNEFAVKAPVLQLPTDYERNGVLDFTGDSVEFTVDQELLTQLRELAQKQGATMYMLLLAAYNVLLAKYSNQEDIVVGTHISGRSHADLEGMIGMFVNMLATRNYPEKDKSFTEFLTHLKERSLKAFDNQDYQLDMLVEQLKPEQGPHRNPLFDATMVYEKAAIREQTQNRHEQDLRISYYGMEFPMARFDITLLVNEMRDHLNFSINYRKALFRKETIEQMSESFVQILQTIATTPEIRLRDIQLVTGLEDLEIVNIDEIDFGF